MQSGKANSKRWVLEFEQASDARFVEPLMGWTGSDDMSQEVKLTFDSSDDAISFAKAQGLEYKLVQPQAKKRVIRAYSDNFTIQPAYEPL